MDEHQPPRPEENIPGLRNLRDVEIEPVNFVWAPYIPAGKLTMLEGDPGLGKSWISAWIAATLSRGDPFPGDTYPRTPQNSILLSAEDGLGDTLKPRLDAMGADYDHIFATETNFTLDARGLKAVENTLRRVTAAIVFMDPIVAFMGAEIDMHRANEVRGLMSAMAGIAKSTGAAIVGVRHLRKQGSTNAKYRGIGSIDFTAAARSALQVGETKSGLTFMEHVKHNLSEAGATLRYEVKDGLFQWLGSMDWDDEAKARGPKPNTRRRYDVGQFLALTLGAGPMTAEAVMAKSVEAGIPTSIILKERHVHAASFKQGKQWWWKLHTDKPETEPTQETLLAEAIARLGHRNG